MSAKSAASTQTVEEATERARLAVGVAAGVQYELDRMIETRASYDTRGDATLAVLRRAALALDETQSKDALKALDDATRNAEYFQAAKPSLDAQIDAVGRTAAAWRETAMVHVEEARAAGAELADVDDQIRQLADEGLRRLS